jgi:FMN phosphatase YigB (HAD superfamily)
MIFRFLYVNVKEEIYLIMKIYLFDLDWVVINSEFFTYWIEKIFWINKNFLGDFFVNEFSDCLIWKKDLKKVIKPYLNNSKWKNWVDNLIKFWFDYENKPDLKILKVIKKLRKDWVLCCVISNQEKYRVSYVKNNMWLNKFFDELFFSCEIWLKKPDIWFFEKVYFLLKDKYPSLRKKDVYFYDDDINNIESWNKIWFNSFLYNKNWAYFP